MSESLIACVPEFKKIHFNEQDIDPCFKCTEPVLSLLRLSLNVTIPKVLF